MAQPTLTWNLDDLITLADFDKAYAQVEASIEQYMQWYEKLSPQMSEAEFQTYLSWAEETGETFERIAARPQLMESADETDVTAKQLKGRIKDLAQKLSEATRKIDLWFKGVEIPGKATLDDANAKRLFASVPDYEYILTYARSAARYTLSEKEENLDMAKDLNGVSVLSDLRDLIAAEQQYVLRVPGEKPQKFDNQEQLLSLVRSHRPEVRRAAYEALYAEYQKNATKYFMVYQSVVKDWDYEAKLRGYASPIAMRNFANQVPDRAIEVLMDVCVRNNDIFQQYFRFKARELGVPKLTRFDIYAPLEEDKTKYPLQEATETVLSTFDDFAPGFAHRAKQIIDANHIDWLPRQNKRSGAFCAEATPKLAPYVMFNYTETMHDVSTIAHELGHGVHFLYASHLPAAAVFPGLPLAETASTFGEMMLFERLLAQTRDDHQRKIMLSDKVNDSYAAICRQNGFVQAEIEIHERMSEGLTPEDLNEIWLKTLHDQFGDSVEVDPIFGIEWAYIPHILHNPFYCYSYNFGELLSTALYARYKQEGKSFVPKLEAILAAGGSREPKQLLAEVGIDMESADFWQGSFEILRGWMKQLEDLTDKSASAARK